MDSGLTISAYAAVELSTHYHQRAPKPDMLGISSGRYLNIRGSIRDPSVQGQLLEFVEMMLQQSADGTGQQVDGVMVLLHHPAPSTQFQA